MGQRKRHTYCFPLFFLWEGGQAGLGRTLQHINYNNNIDEIDKFFFTVFPFLRWEK